MKTVILRGVVTALSSISHNGGETNGLVTQFRRESIVQRNGKCIDIPIISGNAPRGAIRDLGAIEALTNTKGEKVKVDDNTFDLLFSGGHLEKSKNGELDIAGIKELREKLPLLAVLGGSVGSNILPGKLNMGKLIPIAKETLHLFKDDIPLDAYEPQSVFTLTQVEMYTRKDDKKNELLKTFRTSQEAIEHLTSQDSKKSQMMYFVESIKAGTKFFWQIVLKDPTDRELSAFLYILDKYVNTPYALGGKGNIGHGDIKLDFYEDETRDSSVTFNNDKFVAYIDKAKEVKDDMFKYFKEL